jgi:hypothetical protein
VVVNSDIGRYRIQLLNVLSRQFCSASEALNQFMSQASICLPRRRFICNLAPRLKHSPEQVKSEACNLATGFAHGEDRNLKPQEINQIRPLRHQALKHNGCQFSTLISIDAKQSMGLSLDSLSLDSFTVLTRAPMSLACGLRWLTTLSNSAAVTGF